MSEKNSVISNLEHNNSSSGGVYLVPSFAEVSQSITPTQKLGNLDDATKVRQAIVQGHQGPLMASFGGINSI